ncbi:MAG: hypothetical protein MI867_07860 [Pseudomonadales bacterium]|nr:hypothetical protein [Pseudomonadales bacterium]
MKPVDIHLGVSELFSIFIPGLLLVIVILKAFKLEVFLQDSINLWVVIPIASYIVGHVFFAIGSKWDSLYDRVKSEDNQPLLDKIGEIRKSLIRFNCDNINHYKWCRAILSKQHLDGYKEVLRHEADSKLFRSLIIPIILTSMFLLIYQNWYFCLIAIGMAYIAFARYKDQRFKGCRAAYTQVIVLSQIGKLDD